MTENPKDRRIPSWLPFAVAALACTAVVVGVLFVFFRPDRPVATIVPASSSGPAFVVQIVRPRLGLPLGGLLPPELFGLDAQLGFDSQSEGAKIRNVESGRIELAADDWELLLVLDGDGRVAAETQVVFNLVFEGRSQRVRCRPGDPVVGRLNSVILGESGEISGSFDIELVDCEDAETGTPLGWPPAPLILRGSFDRFPLDNHTE